MTEILNITESEYRGLPMPSYSLLKKLDDSGPRSVNRKHVLDSEAIDFGSLLDCRLLCPSEFNNKFYFDATEKPTGQVLDLADYIFNNVPDVVSEDNDELDILTVNKISSDLNLFGSIKDLDKRIAKFNNDLFWNYLKAKQDAAGKIVFTPDTLQEVNDAEQILKTHPKTAHLFTPTKGVEVMTQVMIVSEVSGIVTKIMIDYLRIDHNNKVITPYDLKTTDVRQANFPQHFKKMKYYLQGGLYKLGLINYCRDVLQIGYAIDDFKFIVYSRSDKYPFIWNMGYDWHLMALNGFIGDNGQYVKGLYKLLEEYQFYVENDFYEIDKCFVENEMLEL